MRFGREEEMPPDEIQEPARVDAIPSLVKFVKDHAWEAGFSEKRIEEIGLAATEAIENIIRFTLFDTEEVIRITSTTDNTGALIITISDTGRPFNMLLASTLPAISDEVETEEIPSTRMMKKAIKNIEYIRGQGKNTIIFTCSPLTKEKA